MAVFYPPSPAGVAELVWDSLGKRKREYDMAKGYYSKKRRLVTGRRKYRKRRRSSYRRTPMMTKSNHGLGLGGNFYKNRKLSGLKAYRRKLYNSTNDNRHYRSIDAKTGALNTQTSYTLKTWQSVPLVPHNFFETPILQKTAAEPDRFFERHIVIRGGLCTLTFKNQGADPMRIEVYNIWMKQHNSGTYPPESTTGAEITNIAADPYTFSEIGTTGNSPGREYEIKKRRFTLLDAGQVWTVMDKLPVQKIHTQDYNGQGPNTNDHKMYYWFCVDTPGDTTTGRCDWVRTTNLSFSGDVVNVADPV